MPPDTFWVPLLAGGAGAAAIAIVLLSSVCVRSPQNVADPDGAYLGDTPYRAFQFTWWKRPVFTSSTWDFKDSWATNITAVGAVFTSVLGATQLLKDVLPGVSTDPFTALGIFFGGAVALAPLVYAALAKSPPKPPTAPPTHPPQTTAAASVTGTVGGLLVSSTVTLFGVLGELTAVAVLVDVSSATTAQRWSLIAALAAAAAFIAIYAIRSFVQLSESLPAQSQSLMNAHGNSATL